MKPDVLYSKAKAQMRDINLMNFALSLQEHGYKVDYSPGYGNGLPKLVIRKRRSQP